MIERTHGGMGCKVYSLSPGSRRSVAVIVNCKFIRVLVIVEWQIDSENESIGQMQVHIHHRILEAPKIDMFHIVECFFRFSANIVLEFSLHFDFHLATWRNSASINFE